MCFFIYKAISSFSSYFFKLLHPQSSYSEQVTSPSIKLLHPQSSYFTLNQVTSPSIKLLHPQSSYSTLNQVTPEQVLSDKCITKQSITFVKDTIIDEEQAFAETFIDFLSVSS